MANSFLSPSLVTKEALRILQNNLVFAKGINRQYDNTFANPAVSLSGKAGTQLRIRMPNRYTVATGAALSLQDNAETSQTLTVATQKHVDFTFTSADLTLTIDEFGDRYLKPAMATLASAVDQDCLSMAKDVYNCAGVASVGTTPAHTFPWLRANSMLDIFAAPHDEDRTAVTDPLSSAATVAALTNLLNPTTAISEQYLKGYMGNALGFNFIMDQNVNQFTCGSRTAATEVVVNLGSQTGATLNVTGGTSGHTFLKGDVFTIGTGTAVHSVNAMSKQDTGVTQQFVITADTTVAADTTAALPISPSIITSGAYQTVTASPDNSATVVFYGTASTSYTNNLCYHKDFGTLVTADLEIPKGVDFAAREVYDGISLRVVRAYDVNNDRFPCRVDILYGFKTLYPQWACRVIGDSTTLV